MTTLNGNRILMVEDSAGDGRLIVEMLRDAGVELRVDRSGTLAEALAYLYSEPPDAVLLDLSLPDSEGLATFDAVHAAARDRPIVVISGLADETLANAAVAAGAQDYLVKGRFTGEVLERVLRYSIERKRIEQMLVYSERRYHALIDNSFDGTAIMAPDGTIAYVSSSVSRLLGYTAAQMQGRQAMELVRPGDEATFRACVEKSLRQPREPVVDSVHVRHADGEYRLMEGAVTNLIGDPAVDGLVINYRDITESRRVADQLIESNSRFHQVADNINELFFLASSDLAEMIYANDAYERLTGRPLSQFTQRPMSLMESIHADDRDRMRASLALLQQGGYPPPTEVRVVHLDGTIRWVHAKIAPVLDERGKPYRMSGVILDITRRHEAEQALKDSLLRFRRLAETTFDAIAVSQDGIYKEVNGGFVRMFGYDAETDIIGRRIEEFVAPESIEDFRRRLAEEETGTFEVVGVRRDGGRILLETTVRFDAVHGERLRISAIRDITERRSLEEQFRQAQKMEAVGRLAGGVAHDFNNLLTVISGNAELLQAELPANDPRHEEVKQIIQASHSAAGLTRQLLAFSRRQSARPQAVSLRAVVAESEKMLRRVVGEDVSLSVQLAADDAIVQIDPTQVDQIVMNLVINARDAMPTGGRLTIATGLWELASSPLLRHWECAPGRYATLTVSDTGTGMSEETLRHVFEPFFTTKEAGKGTGLGLATVYGIVKQAGGLIDVESSLGEGSSFRVCLPLMTDSNGGGGVAAPATSTGKGTETVLLVEDAADMRLVAAEALRRLGYTVLEASCGAEALAVAGRPNTHIDLLLTDVVMPEMSGRVLADQFRVMWPLAKVLFMTGYTDDAVIRHGVSTARDTIIAKPFTPGVLASRVRDILGHSAKLPA